MEVKFRIMGSMLWIGLLGVVVIGGYIWWTNAQRNLDRAIRQPGFADKLAGALSPAANKRGMKWNPTIHRWVDMKTGKPLSQGEQSARYGCRIGCTEMAPGPEKNICLRFCKQYGP